MLHDGKTIDLPLFQSRSRSYRKTKFFKNRFFAWLELKVIYASENRKPSPAKYGWKLNCFVLFCCGGFLVHIAGQKQLFSIQVIIKTEFRKFCRWIETGSESYKRNCCVIRF